MVAIAVVGAGGVSGGRRAGSRGAGVCGRKETRAGKTGDGKPGAVVVGKGNRLRRAVTMPFPTL